MAKRAKKVKDALSASQWFQETFGVKTEAELEALSNAAHARVTERASKLWKQVDAGATCTLCHGDVSREQYICSWFEQPAHKNCVLRASLPIRVNPCCYTRDGMAPPWA